VVVQSIAYQSVHRGCRAFRSTDGFVPLLDIARSLPSWIPGLSFPEYARMGRQMFTKARYWAFGLVKEDVVSRIDEDMSPFLTLLSRIMVSQIPLSFPNTLGIRASPPST
jgi:hypothetical protein